MRTRPPVLAPGTREKLAFLRDPRNHAEGTTRVEVIETHFAWVFLAGELVYKMKKPMRQDSMDYRTLAARRQGCRNEVRLNRRLARDIYLGVVPLSRHRDGALRLGRGGRVVEWLVGMRRLPAAGMLDARIAAATVDKRDIEALAAVLASFFASARRRGMSAGGYRRRLRARVLRNQRDLHAPDLRLERTRIDAVIRVQLDYLERAGTVLDGRAGRLLDGHGDLRPEHVFLGPPGCVIDCLEFSPDLRRLDPAEEIAFLALECARLGASAVATHLVRLHGAASGDRVPGSLYHFYMSQCATTRAKIAAWHLRDPQYLTRRPWISRANSYLDDALHHGRLALAGADAGTAPSFLVRSRPLPQQGRNSHAAQHATDGLAEQWRDRQHGQLAVIR